MICVDWQREVSVGDGEEQYGLQRWQWWRGVFIQIFNWATEICLTRAKATGKLDRERLGMLCNGPGCSQLYLLQICFPFTSIQSNLTSSMTTLELVSRKSDCSQNEINSEVEIKLYRQTSRARPRIGHGWRGGGAGASNTRGHPARGSRPEVPKILEDRSKIDRAVVAIFQNFR